MYLSHGDQSKTGLPESIIQKPYIIELTEHTVIFQDGSEESLDEILYCTGCVVLYKNFFWYVNSIVFFRIQIYISLSHSSMRNKSNRK